MAFKEGEVYRCPEAECGCEITDTRGAAPDKGGNLTALLLWEANGTQVSLGGAGTAVFLPLIFSAIQIEGGNRD